jgi:hypothetical protein
VPPAINEIIARATAKDPAQRYASAAEMVAAFAAAPVAHASNEGAPKALWFGVGAVAVVGLVGAFALLSAPSSLSTTQAVVVSQPNVPSAGDSAPVAGADSAVAMPTAVTPSGPSAAELEAQARQGLEAALNREFGPVDPEYPWVLSDVRLARDGDGRWWGIGGQNYTDYGYSAWAVMVDDGSGWRTYGQIEEVYELTWMGSPVEQMPSEVREVLFATLEGRWVDGF